MSLLLLLLVAAAGAGLLRCLLGPPAQGPAWALEWGGGFLLGFILLGGVLVLLGDADLQTARWVGLAALLAATGLSWSWALAGRGARPQGADSPADAVPLGMLAAIAAFLALLLAAIAIQVISLPTLPWDGWNAWLAKVRVWSELGTLRPALTLGDWLQAGAASGPAVAGAPYPEALPRSVAWLLSWHGGWSESRAHLPWLGLWLALGGLQFGGLVRAGVPRRWALAASALMLSLPLVSAHAALSGYADLWLAGVVLFAVLLLLSWRRQQRIPILLLCVLCLVMMPMVKLEGAVYALLLGSAALLWQLPFRLRWSLVAGIALLPLWLWAGMGIALPLPGLGWVELIWGQVTMPVVGTLVLEWREVGSAVVQALFVLPGFSLLWYLALLVPILRWRRVLDPQLAPVMAFLTATTVFHFVLFFFTDASAWAENLTSLNRLLLHVTPAWVALLTLLLAPQPGVQARRYGRFAR